MERNYILNASRTCLIGLFLLPMDVQADCSGFDGGNFQCTVKTGAPTYSCCDPNDTSSCADCFDDDQCNHMIDKGNCEDTARHGLAGEKRKLTS